MSDGNPVHVAIAKGIGDGIPVRSQVEESTPVIFESTLDPHGTLTIHRVPIFCVCERGDTEFDEAWVNKAVAKAQRAEAENYLPPLHVKHHEPGGADDAVRGAGFFRVLGTGPITLKGKTRLAVFADLIVTDPEIQAEILARRLPYRSVEIFNVDKPELNSLALLDHEAPFLELPMLMVSEANLSIGSSFQAWRMDHTPEDRGTVALFRRGIKASVLFREDDSTTYAKAKTEVPDMTKTQAKLFESDKKDDEDKSEDMEGEGGMDVGAIVKAIESGEISLADFEAVKAAMAAREGGAVDDEPAAEEGAPAPMPGAQAMTKTPDAAALNMAAMQGKIEALEAQGTERDTAEVRRTEVGEALERLNGRPLGSDLEAKLIKFHKGATGKPELFEAYVTSMEQTTAVMTADTSDAHRFAGQNGAAPKEAQAYQKDGLDSVSSAARFCAEWDEIKQSPGGGSLHMSKERYVEINMTKNAARQEQEA